MPAWGVLRLIALGGVSRGKDCLRGRGHGLNFWEGNKSLSDTQHRYVPAIRWDIILKLLELVSYLSTRSLNLTVNDWDR